MNFCSHCGSADVHLTIPEGDQFSRWICRLCKTVHYQNPNMITGAICLWEGEILLARRGIEPRKGFWNLPCGFLELNETVEEGAIREVKEETGLNINLNYLHTVYSLPHANQVYLIFVAAMQSNAFTITPESTEIQLFAPGNLPWDEIAFSSNTFALQRFLQDQENGFKGVHLGTFRKTRPY